LSSLLNAVMTWLAVGDVGLAEVPAGIPHVAEPATAPAPRPLRILLAEDNVVNQKLALRLLEKMGLAADVVGNGVEALESLGRKEYDVVLMDLHMPEMDGWEATREIRRRWPSGRPQIIAVTADAMAGEAERCLGAGSTSFAARWTSSRRGAALTEHDMSESTRPPVDQSVLDKLVADTGGDEHFVIDLIDEYLRDTTELLDAIAVAIDARDATSARRAAHTLKATSGSLGANAVADAARVVEALCNDGRWDRTADSVSRLNDAASAAAIALVHQQSRLGAAR
jgi:CheY-like chemotaxis protein